MAETNGKHPPSGFRHWERQGKQIVALPHDFINKTGHLHVTRITNNPNEIAAVIEYRLCEMMAMSGFSYRAIGNTLALTRSEVAHRIQKLGVKVRDYRDGTSPLAKQVIARLDEVAQRRLVDNLEKFLLK